MITYCISHLGQKLQVPTHILSLTSPPLDQSLWEALPYGCEGWPVQLCTSPYTSTWYC